MLDLIMMLMLVLFPMVMMVFLIGTDSFLTLPIRR